ncbi:MAG: glycosyltransferase family 2 protein [Propioniciclava sp.]|uniref:glycosyltransferase family 2 protein n=1 Tax=Propioniciclava sp. TaxID=2038686 RepID=UPI0039E323D4
MPNSALIVVNYGSSELLRQNLRAVSTAVPEIAVYVVDCFSTEAEQAAVGDLAEGCGWHPVLLSENVGFGAGVNRGAELALSRGAEVLLVLNPDAVLDRCAVLGLIEAVNREPMSMVAPRVVRPDGSTWAEAMDLHLDDGSIAAERFRARHPGRPRRRWLSGACFAISAQLWRRIGGFDEDYFLYWEDVDLSYRVLAAGGELVVDHSILATHDEGGTQRTADSAQRRSNLFYYYNIRNRLLYAGKNLDPDARRAWRRSSLRAGVQTVWGGERRGALKAAGPWIALARGLRDGIKGRAGR